MRRELGFSLLELLVTMTLFSVVALVSFIMMTRGTELWRDSSGQQTASLSLAVVDRHFEQDLLQASAVGMSTTLVPSSLAGAPDGSALWFLSAKDPTTGDLVRKGDGTPFWQRNILYYLVVPDRHQELYGLTCAGGPGGGDNDGFCPHKMLIRLAIDSGDPTTPTSDPLTTEEALIADVSSYLLRPDGMDVSALQAPAEVESVKIVTTRLLYFQATPSGNEVALDLRATSLDGLGREAQIGSESLMEHSRTFQYLKSFFPRN